MSGFLGKNVGLNVGFFELSDIPRCRRISRLQAKCRVCRVFIRSTLLPLVQFCRAEIGTTGYVTDRIGLE